MNVVLPTRMTVDEFLAGARARKKAATELFEGRVIMQQPQSWGHAELCVRIYNALAAAIGHSGVPFYAAPVGMTVRIVEKTAFEPDALVAPLPKPQRLDLEISNPVLVVEVVSRSTAKRDRTDKLAGYFKVPSIQHYLIFDPEKREVIWHHRTAAGTLQPPATLREGLLALDPPGIELSVADIFPPE